jgi:hypothetical protein
MMFDELRASFVVIRQSLSTFLIMLLCVDLAFTGISAIGDTQGFA